MGFEIWLHKHHINQSSTGLKIHEGLKETQVTRLSTENYFYPNHLYLKEKAGHWWELSKSFHSDISAWSKERIWTDSRKVLSPGSFQLTCNPVCGHSFVLWWYVFFLLAGKSFYHLSKQQALIPGSAYSHVKHFLIKGLKGNKKQCAQILVDSALPLPFKNSNNESTFASPRLREG